MNSEINRKGMYDVVVGILIAIFISAGVVLQHIPSVAIAVLLFLIMVAKSHCSNKLNK